MNLLFNNEMIIHKTTKITELNEYKYKKINNNKPDLYYHFNYKIIEYMFSKNIHFKIYFWFNEYLINLLRNTKLLYSYFKKNNNFIKEYILSSEYHEFMNEIYLNLYVNDKYSKILNKYFCKNHRREPILLYEKELKKENSDKLFNFYMYLHNICCPDHLKLFKFIFGYNGHPHILIEDIEKIIKYNKYKTKCNILIDNFKLLKTKYENCDSLHNLNEFENCDDFSCKYYYSINHLLNLFEIYDDLHSIDKFEYYIKKNKNNIISYFKKVKIL